MAQAADAGLWLFAGCGFLARIATAWIAGGLEWAVLAPVGWWSRWPAGGLRGGIPLCLSDCLLLPGLHGLALCGALLGLNGSLSLVRPRDTAGIGIPLGLER